MDINDDGNLDILSGSYSRMEQDMAGLFQVLYGQDDGSFLKAQVLNGADGEPLICPGDNDQNVTDKICTRPFAVDINGDGKLDIVAGNFTGTFFVFEGEGDCHFSPEAYPLMAEGEPIRVPTHSDPFFVDWDGDGDLDMFSGSGQGGAFWCENVGSTTEPKFRQAAELIAPAGYSHELVMGDEHITGPQTGTRVWVEDITGDGKLDILIGDQVSLTFPAKGLDEAEARARLDKWNAEQEKVMAVMNGRDGPPSDEEMEAINKKYMALYEQRSEFLREDTTGFVWLYAQR